MGILDTEIVLGLTVTPFSGLLIPTRSLKVVMGMLLDDVIEIAKIAHRIGMALISGQFPPMPGLREVLRPSLTAGVEHAEARLRQGVPGFGFGLNVFVIHF
jgi:hypothetical protein